MKKFFAYAVAALATISMVAMTSCGSSEPAKKQVGIQMYSVHQDYANIEPALQKIAEAGYTAIETLNFGGVPQCFGLEPAAFKALCDKYGLKIVSTHGGVAYNPEDLEGTMAKWRELFAGLKTMGAKYCVIPGQNFGSTLADIEACCDFCNKVGEVAKEYGLKLGYHNHAGDFAKVEGETILDYVIKHTDADKFLIELDVCKTNMGDADYMHYLKTYGDRIKILHAKEDGVLGTGPIDFEAVFNQFYANGAIDCFVEYELPFRLGEDQAENERNLAAMWKGVADCCKFMQESEFVKSCEY